MLVGKEIVNSRFKVIRKIDNGSFGEIYEGKMIISKDRRANILLQLLRRKLSMHTQQRL